MKKIVNKNLRHLEIMKVWIMVVSESVKKLDYHYLSNVDLRVVNMSVLKQIQTNHQTVFLGG